MTFIELVCGLLISFVFVSWLWFLLDVFSIEKKRKCDKNERNNKIK